MEQDFFDLLEKNSPQVGFTFTKTNYHPGTTKIGDILVFTSLVEMMARKSGKKLIDIDKHWQFDYNPFVVRDVPATKVLHFQALADSSTRNNYLRNLPVMLSINDRYTCMFSLECIIRHPKLYRYENIERIPNKVVIHTTGDRNQPMMLGEDAPKIMNNTMIEVIKHNYRNYDIVQVGATTDLDAGVIDKRGLPIWDSVKEIAECTIFIGVDSGPYNIAKCYPHINKRLIITEYDKSTLQNYYIPLNSLQYHNQWKDYGTTFFNRSETEDWGVTYSFTKI